MTTATATLPPVPEPEFWSVGRVIEDLITTMSESHKEVQFKGWAASYGRLEGGVKASIAALQYIQGRQRHTVPTPIPVPNPGEKCVAVTFEVPLSHIGDVDAYQTQEREADEHGGTPCERIYIDIHVRDIQVDHVPPGWELTDYDRQAAAKIWESRQ